MFFEKRYASTEMVNPDFSGIARAYNIEARSVSRRSELQAAIQEMMDAEGSYFLEVIVEQEENVFPMIPTGASVSEIRLE